jgi:hypothetical protein
LDKTFLLVQKLEDDCDHVHRIYRQRAPGDGAPAILLGFIDMWDAQHGKGFFVKELISYVKKQERKERQEVAS